MGCCTSREANPSPYAGTSANPVVANSSSSAPDSSRAAINAPTNNTSRSASHQSNTPRGSRNNLPNKPLQLPSPVPSCPPERALSPWTRKQLVQERVAFFETRVTGNAQIWEALRLICDMLRNGDLTGAQTLFDTAGLTCPTGKLERERSNGSRKGGVFDERGQRYDIPGWVMVDPNDIIEDEEGLEKPGMDAAEEDEEIEGAGDDARERRDEKGKGKVGEVEDSMDVRIRLTDRANDLIVPVGRQQKVRVLVRRIQEKTGMTARLRLAYFGRMLNEDKTLADQSFKEGDILVGFVTEA